MKVHIKREYETADGKRFPKRRQAKAHERRVKLDAEREADRRKIKLTAGGNWSIPCWRCGKRHVQPYSDDYVWCPACQKSCGGEYFGDNEPEFDGHEPDDDDPTRCYRCGGAIK